MVDLMMHLIVATIFGSGLLLFGAFLWFVIDVLLNREQVPGG